jgi:hypothetical protein
MAADCVGDSCPPISMDDARRVDGDSGERTAPAPAPPPPVSAPLPAPVPMLMPAPAPGVKPPIIEPRRRCCCEGAEGAEEEEDEGLSASPPSAADTERMRESGRAEGMPPVNTAEAGVVPRLRPFESPDSGEEADEDADAGEEDEDEDEDEEADASSRKKEGERGIEPPPGGAVPITPPPIRPVDEEVGVDTSRCSAGIEAEALIIRPKPPPPPLMIELAEEGDAEASEDWARGSGIPEAPPPRCCCCVPLADDGVRAPFNDEEEDEKKPDEEDEVGVPPRAIANKSDTERDAPIPPIPPIPPVPPLPIPLPLPLPLLANIGCDCSALLAAPSLADCTTEATRCCAAAAVVTCHACGDGDDEEDEEEEGRYTVLPSAPIGGGDGLCARRSSARPAPWCRMVAPPANRKMGSVSALCPADDDVDPDDEC